MQGELRTLAHRSNEQADAGYAQHHPVAAPQRRGEGNLRQGVLLGEDFSVVQRIAISDQQTDAENEAEVTNPVDEEGLHIGKDRRWLGIPEADQQVRNQSNRLPAEKQLQHVVAHHQHQHAEGEQRDIAEEALVAGVFLHIADGVDMHHQRDEADHTHHHRGQSVDQKSDFHLQAADHHPFINGLVEASAFKRHRPQRHHRNDESDQYTENCDRMGAAAAHLLAEQSGHDSASQRGQRYCQQHVLRELCSHLAISPSARRAHRH